MKVKVVDIAGEALDWAVQEAFNKDHTPSARNYSTNWDFAGPIIEDNWHTIARQRTKLGLEGIEFEKDGVLVGLMRCFVISRLGPEINIPDDIEIDGGTQPRPRG